MSSTHSNSLADDALLEGLERLDRLEDQKVEAQDAIKEVLGELKAAGHSSKVVRHLVTLRRMDESKRDEAREQRELLNAYIEALGL